MEIPLPLIVNDLTDGIVIIDTGGHIEVFNKKAREIASVPYQENLDHTPVLPLGERVRELRDLYEVARGASEGYRNKIRNINGYRVRCSVLPLSGENEVMGALLKLEDITHEVMLRDENIDLQNSFRRQAEISVSGDVFAELVGESDSFNHVKRLAHKAAMTNSTVLLLGESGTGKSFLAENIHRVSARKNQPFICVSCGSLPETLLESELFGYEKGAFTGASKEGRPGYFELANRGTVFLDEVGDMSASMQARLLSVLQEKKFMRVGGVQQKKVDVKIIAATNKDLKKMVDGGEFREDLYYRINVFPIYIPPLRDRKEDIYLLAHSMIPRLCKRMGLDEKRISSDAITSMLAYNWPGNIRQMENVLERAINICEGNIISRRDLHLEKNEEGMPPGRISRPAEFLPAEVKPLREAVEEFERDYIEHAVTLADGDRRLAMKRLRIGKTTFYRKLKGF